jgi:uracil-DNA glycosylase
MPTPLEMIDAKVKNCKRCGLCDGRKNTVFGEGNPSFSN